MSIQNHSSTSAHDLAAIETGITNFEVVARASRSDVATTAYQHLHRLLHAIGTYVIASPYLFFTYGLISIVLCVFDAVKNSTGGITQSQPAPSSHDPCMVKSLLWLLAFILRIFEVAIAICVISSDTADCCEQFDDDIGAEERLGRICRVIILVVCIYCPLKLSSA